MKDKQKILIVGAGLGASDAVSGIMTNLANLVLNKQEVYFCGPNSIGTLLEDEHNIYVPIPNLKSEIYRKIRTLFRLDSCISDAKLIFSILEKYANLEFDLVIAVGGVFSFIEAAYLFSLKYNIPLKIIYFDPFANNVFSINPKKRMQIEKRWLSYADVLLFNIENTCPSYLQRSPKLKYFYIPMFLKPVKNLTQDRTLVYGGAFYRHIRTPKLLYDFALSIKNKGFTIECYSQLKHCPQDIGIKFFPTLRRKDFEKRCQSASALIYIGNSGGDSKSSKYLEYIAMHKPIIGINVEPDNIVRKYKYYIDERDPHLIDKLNNINQDEILAYSPYIDFPNRNPKTLTDILFV